MKRTFLTIFFGVITASVASAGWFQDAVENAGKALGNRAVGETGDAAYDGVKKGTKDSIMGSDKSSSQKNSNNSDNRSNNRNNGDRNTDSGNVSTDDISTDGPIYSKYDFIPGDKVIFFDDFSDTDEGEFPRKWHLNGPKYDNNSVEVISYQGKRFLRASPGTGRQGISTQYIRLNQKSDLPEKFTIEFDALLTPYEGSSVYHSTYVVLLYNSKDTELTLGAEGNPGVLGITGSGCRSNNTETTVAKSDGKIHHVAISVNKTFVKVYIDNIRVINDPDGAKRPITLVGLSMYMASSLPSEKIMFTNFRLAEGGKSIKSALDTDGKIVTHGILFDTGKDVIKPESLPTLKMILGLLTDNPDLKFSIEGHTDDQGKKGINQPLSEKRAAAVKTWLAGNGIESARLKTKGFGDSKPIDKNNNTEGRANNRRVEFVKF